MSLQLPAVRFVRCFDIVQLRMVNIWMCITTQDQLRNSPLATELTVTAQNVEEAMKEIRKWQDLPEKQRWIDTPTCDEIEKAAQAMLEAQPSVYRSELLRASLDNHAKSGFEGLSITVLRKGKVLGVDVAPSWEEDLKKGFDFFSRAVLEPAFKQIEQTIEEHDSVEVR